MVPGYHVGQGSIEHIHHCRKSYWTGLLYWTRARVLLWQACCPSFGVGVWVTLRQHVGIALLSGLTLEDMDSDSASDLCWSLARLFPFQCWFSHQKAWTPGHKSSMTPAVQMLWDVVNESAEYVVCVCHDVPKLKETPKNAVFHFRSFILNWL